jgi:hypothetical protein
MMSRSAPGSAAASLDGGWLYDIFVVVPSGERLPVALTVQDAQLTVYDVKRILLAQYGIRQPNLDVAATRLVEQAGHDSPRSRRSRLTSDFIDRELHDTMLISELKQRVDEGAALQLHVMPPHCWLSKSGESLACDHNKFAQQPPPGGRRYVCISNTGKANIRSTASLSGQVLREIRPGASVLVYEEKMCDGHLRGRISDHDDSTGHTEWLSIRTFYGNPLMQAASLEEQVAALEPTLSDLQPSLPSQGRPPAQLEAAATNVDLEVDLDFGDMELG